MNPQLRKDRLGGGFKSLWRMCSASHWMVKKLVVVPSQSWFAVPRSCTGRKSPVHRASVGTWWELHLQTPVCGMAPWVGWFMGWPSARPQPVHGERRRCREAANSTAWGYLRPHTALRPRGCCRLNWKLQPDARGVWCGRHPGENHSSWVGKRKSKLFKSLVKEVNQGEQPLPECLSSPSTGTGLGTITAPESFRPCHITWPNHREWLHITFIIFYWVRAC